MKRILSTLIIACFISLIANSANGDGQIWLQRARNGQVEAMYQTALRYHYGIDGLAKNDEKARFWAEKGAQTGNVKCMLIAAETYDDVKTKLFLSKQILWNERAGEAGSIDGAFRARDNWLTVKYALQEPEDKLACVRNQIYWNNVMLSHPDIEPGAKQQSLQIKEMLAKELAELTAAMNPDSNDEANEKVNLNAVTAYIPTTTHPASTSFTYRDSYQRAMLHIRKGGIYDGLCIFNAKIEESEDDPEGLYVGKLVDGKCILPLRFDGYLTSDSEAKGFEFGKNFKGITYMIYPQSYEINANRSDGSGCITVDLSKLTDSDITNLLDHCVYDTRFGEIYLIPGSNGYVQKWLPESEYPSSKKVSLKLINEAKPRIIRSPRLSSINSGTTLERVIIQPNGTTLEMSFINSAGIPQWNINRDAYITCDATPGVKYRLLRTQGVNISPKPTQTSGNRNERIAFSMTFEPVPLHAKTINLVEGPSRDNFHAVNIDISPRE